MHFNVDISNNVRDALRSLYVYEHNEHTNDLIRYDSGRKFWYRVLTSQRGATSGSNIVTTTAFWQT